MTKQLAILGIFIMAFTVNSCSTIKKTYNNLNAFSIQDDKNLGLQVSKEINSNPKDFPILPESSNREVYKYIRKITTNILNSGKVKHKNVFKWEVKIIDDDKTLNAFCTPGGYIYVYTGLIKYLDSEDQLAGVMGHEIAHADLRHSTRQMTKIYGLDALRQIALSTTKSGQTAGQLSEVALGLISLKYGRNHEEEADDHSVRYLCPTAYNAAGAAGFFIKLNSKKGGGRPPAFLSTHPDPGNRVVAIKGRAQKLKCRGKAINKSEYNRIKSLLK